jgi:spoIIIJ-associated protein
MDFVEAEGGTIDDAIASALRQLGTTRDRVEVEILNNAARGFLGFGARKARVRATLRALRADVAGATAAASTPEVRAREPRPPSAGPRRDELPSAAAAAAIATEATLASRPRAVARGARDAAERAAELMREVVRHLGVTATVTLEQMDEGQFLIDLSGDASGILIGRRGQMLDALEYLMNRVVAHDGGEATRIIVDVENYRARRREALESMARRSAEKAKEEQKPVTLNPMNPRDRRIVHMALQNDPTLVTRSAGEGYLRKLVIAPAGVDRRRRGSRRGARP